MMILSTKLIATMLVLFSAAFLIDSIRASQDDDDEGDSVASSKILVFSLSYPLNTFSLPNS